MNEQESGNKAEWVKPQVEVIGTLVELTKLKGFTKINGIVDDLYQGASSV